MSNRHLYRQERETAGQSNRQTIRTPTNLRSNRHQPTQPAKPQVRATDTPKHSNRPAEQPTKPPLLTRGFDGVWTGQIETHR